MMVCSECGSTSVVIASSMTIRPGNESDRVPKRVVEAVPLPVSRFVWRDRRCRGCGHHMTTIEFLLDDLQAIIRGVAAVEMAKLIELEGCVDPGAEVVGCCVCGRPVKTCERAKPVEDGHGNQDWRCPTHPNGAELSDGRWTCSSECWTKAAESPRES